MKVALLHDWLTGMRGGEKCLEVFCELYPDADLYTLLHLPGTVSPAIERMHIHTSPLQKCPGARNNYRHYYPLFPWILRQWQLPPISYDLVLSTSHCVAKGIPIHSSARHICYCFTPVRYLWCQTDQYFSGNWKQSALKMILPMMKNWDLESNERVDEFIGISDNVSDRIRRFYGREARTIYPPVDTEFYQPSPHVKREDFYLMVGAIEPYKRVDLAVDAFRQLPNHQLKIVGKGTEKVRIQSNAPANVEFLGWKSDEEIRQLYRSARALLFPGEEDFGIVPLEAQACGCPVIGFGAGGLLETVIEGRTGMFFLKQNSHCLKEALVQFEQLKLNSEDLVGHASYFSRTRFQKEIENDIAQPNQKQGVAQLPHLPNPVVATL